MFCCQKGFPETPETPPLYALAWGHFLMGQVGLICKTKLSGYDPDITCSLENIVGICMWLVSELWV